MTIRIKNHIVEKFINKQIEKENISTNDYLVNLILNEIELVKIKKDMDILKSEINDINNEKIKIKSAHLILNEL